MSQPPPHFGRRIAAIVMVLVLTIGMLVGEIATVRAMRTVFRLGRDHSGFPQR